MGKSKDVINKPVYSDIAYDDAFRTMEGECDDVLIPFVNYFFSENYNDTAKIVRLRNESFIERPDHSEEKRITDSHFSITQDGIRKKYHLECESKAYDGTILLRMFEYDTQIAISEAESCSDVLRVKMPIAGVLLLRRSDKAPEKACICIETPNGSVSYDIKIIKETDFSLDMIFENRLYMLLPFYVFNYEKSLGEIDSDKERITEFLNMYGEIFNRLELAQSTGLLSAKTIGVIISVTHSVFCKLASGKKNLLKKGDDYMGGKVLDLPEVVFYKRGIEKGIEQGLEQGMEKVIENMLKKGISNDEIANLCDCDISVVKKVAEKISMLA